MGEAVEAAKGGVRSNPCKFVLDAIMACVETGDPLMLGEDFAPPKDPSRSEIHFLEWIVESFKVRTSWPVGKWVAAVMEEALTKAVDVAAAATVPP